jgi:hypothetical protein
MPRLEMRRIASVASMLVSGLHGIVTALLTFLGPSWDGPHRKYRPEDHYMRGPGPKWREKHFAARVSAGGS